MPTIIIINVNAMVPMAPPIAIIINVTAVAQRNSRFSHATLTQPFPVFHDDIIMYDIIMISLCLCYVIANGIYVSHLSHRIYHIYHYVYVTL
jgi:hypothetical protein